VNADAAVSADGDIIRTSMHGVFIAGGKQNPPACPGIGQSRGTANVGCAADNENGLLYLH
jgi:hypothetical protein